MAGSFHGAGGLDKGRVKVREVSREVSGRPGCNPFRLLAMAFVGCNHGCYLLSTLPLLAPFWGVF